MSLRDHVSAQWSDLSASQRRVAQWLINNPAEAVFLNVREVGARTRTSAATVVRLAQVLGFGGFPMLLEVLQSELLDSLRPAARLSATLEGIQSSSDSDADVLKAALQQDVESLEDTMSLIRPDDFGHAADALHRAAVAYVVGVGLSAAAVLTLAFRIRRLGKPVVTVTADEDLYTPILPATPEDLLLAVGFQPVAPAVLRCAAYAKRHSIPVLAITDTFGSALQTEADVTLHVKRGPLTHLTSVVAPIAVVNALAMALAVRRSEEAATAYARLEELQVNADSIAESIADESRGHS